jgi:lactoylglutathione lyase
MSKATIYYFKLVVRDSEALARFYNEVFGLIEVRRFDALAYDDPHLEIFLAAGPEEGANQIALLHYVNKPAPPPGEASIAVAAALAAGGTSVRAAQTLEEHNFRYAIIADPEGHSIEVMQSGVV